MNSFGDIAGDIDSRSNLPGFFRVYNDSKLSDLTVYSESAKRPLAIRNIRRLEATVFHASLFAEPNSWPNQASNNRRRYNVKKTILTLALWALVISASICSSISVSFAQDGKGTETSTTTKGAASDTSGDATDAPKKKGGISKKYVAAGVLVVGVIVFVVMQAKKKQSS